jgi:hypothetical protein
MMVMQMQMMAVVTMMKQVVLKAYLVIVKQQAV